MKSFDLKYKFCLLKAWFDKGYGLTSALKWLLAILGLNTGSTKQILILAFIYAILCFLAGFLWYKFNFIRAEAEVGNRYNYFVQEMRNKLEMAGANIGKSSR